MLFVMQLTLHTDYALRILIYLTVHQNRLVTITELAEFFGISKNHLIKIVHKLGKLGYLQTIRGKSGGIRLARSASLINIGEVVRALENNFYLVECFDQNKQGKCAVQPICGLTRLFAQATEQFMAVLNRTSLADVVSLNLID